MDVLMENQPPLTSPDGSSNGNPPERCPRDSTQEDHIISNQGINQGECNNAVKDEEGEVGVMEFSEGRYHHLKDIAGSAQENHISHEDLNQNDCNNAVKEEVKEEDEVAVMEFSEGHTDPLKDVAGSSQEDHISHEGINQSDPTNAVKEEIKKEEDDDEVGVMEFSEGHKDPLKDFPMETASDSNPPESCPPPPLDSQGSTQEDPTIPLHQGDGSSNRNPTESCPPPLDSTQESHTLPHHDVDGPSNSNPPQSCPPPPPLNSTQEDHTVPHHDQVVQIMNAFQCAPHRDTSRMSAVWNYFKINEDNRRMADCKLCSAKLSRGGTKISSHNTSNLIKHLKIKHKRAHEEFTAITSSSTRKPALQKSLARGAKLSRDNPRAVKITEALARFIILDDQPLSIVENMAFRRFVNVLEPKYDIPSRHYITDVILPKIHGAVQKRITVMLQKDVKAISFTTDVWSPLSLICIMAQWIDGEFSLHQVMLHATKFEGSHTAQAIADILEEMLQTWAIPKSLVHVVVHDNAENMVKGMEEAGLPSISCVAHTLQLAVTEGLLSQRKIADTVGAGRRIIGHFEHSTLAYARLQDIQKELGQAVRRLQQDEPTRWNSTFYMLKSLLEQKRSLGVYLSKRELPATITSNQWNLIEKVIEILAPFEEMTRQVSCSDAFASDVIPAVTVLQKVLSNVDKDLGIKTMKSTLLAALQKRFSDTERNPLYCIATLLDPRYKDRFFCHSDTSREAKEMLRQELQNVSEETMISEEREDPASKRPHRDQPGTSLDSVFAEIAGEGSSTSESSAPKSATIQLEAYLGETTVPHSEKPLKYWAVHRVRFPTLATTAQRFLSAPCSSVESERLFDSASNVLTDGGNGLMAERAEMLLFLQKNLPLTFEK